MEVDAALSGVERGIEIVVAPMRQWWSCRGVKIDSYIVAAALSIGVRQEKIKMTDAMFAAFAFAEAQFDSDQARELCERMGSLKDYEVVMGYALGKK